jgi:tRNA uridine 5-carboxymethylaminomethyl modification enzyme
VAERLGLYDDAEQAIVAARLERENALVAAARATSIRPEQAAPMIARSETAPLAHAVKVAEVVRRPGIGLAELLEAAGVSVGDLDEALVTAELELKYAGYYLRERQAADRLRRMGDFVLPSDLPYGEMRSLTIEARQKMAAQRPMTLAQAARIPGVTPADLQNLVIEVERLRRQRVGVEGD